MAKKQMTVATGYVVRFFDDETRQIGIRSFAFNAREWLVENVAPYYDSDINTSGVNGKLGRQSWITALNEFIKMRGERTSYLGAIISIEHAYSKNYEWESYRATYSSSGKVSSETCVRMYDEVLAMQLKLSIG
jgi:hypothetical protein